MIRTVSVAPFETSLSSIDELLSVGVLKQVKNFDEDRIALDEIEVLLLCLTLLGEGGLIKLVDFLLEVLAFELNGVFSKSF